MLQRRNFKNFKKSSVNNFFFLRKKKIKRFVDKNGRKTSPHKVISKKQSYFNSSNQCTKTSWSFFKVLFAIHKCPVKFKWYSIWLDSTGHQYLNQFMFGYNFNWIYSSHNNTPLYEQKQFIGGMNEHYKYGMVISNMHSSCNEDRLSTSPGSYAILLNSFLVLLPSSKKKNIKNFSFQLGRNFTHKKTYTRKGYISLRVRGIAKNPVDHPNGGRSNTKGSFKTPWGLYAKANK